MELIHVKSQIEELLTQELFHGRPSPVQVLDIEVRADMLIGVLRDVMSLRGNPAEAEDMAAVIAHAMEIAPANRSIDTLLTLLSAQINAKYSSTGTESLMRDLQLARLEAIGKRPKPQIIDITGVLAARAAREGARLH
jgi:hypothetical protein